MQRVADSYLAVPIQGKSIANQLQDKAEFKTAQFPIVAPHQQYDLQGNTVGTAENPITLQIDGTTVQPYDGSGTQAPTTSKK